MPLLKKKPFKKVSLPANLKPEETVFHCIVTNEIFRRYADFFERSILLNSLVWSCASCGAEDLTYEDAARCEARAQLPVPLARGLLYLANLAGRASFKHLLQDVWTFSKDRYFLGETVNFCTHGQKESQRKGRVARVVAPSVQSKNDTASLSPDVVDLTQSDDDDDVEGGGGGDISSEATVLEVSPSDKFYYVVQAANNSKSSLFIPAANISRTKNSFNKERLKSFLKEHTLTNNGKYAVKPLTAQKFGLDSVCWSDVFAGRQPAFSLVNVEKRCSDSNGLDSIFEEICKPKPKRPRPSVDRHELAKAEQAAAAAAAASAEAKLKEEESRCKARERARDQRRLREVLLREWQSCREDMLCDDLKVLPDLAIMSSRLPHALLGTTIAIVNFFTCFAEHLHMSADLPGGAAAGVTLELVETALLSSSPTGPLADLLFALLTALHSVQDEVVDEVNGTEVEALSARERLSMQNKHAEEVRIAIRQASLAARLPQLVFGEAVQRLPLDSQSVSELLRLHLMSSGASITNDVAYRFRLRGGFQPQDDAGLALLMRNPQLVHKLSMTPVFDLTPSDKLTLLSTLIEQLLAYPKVRDAVDEAHERRRALRIELRTAQSDLNREERHVDLMVKRKRKEEKLRGEQSPAQQIDLAPPVRDENLDPSGACAGADEVAAAQKVLSERRAKWSQREVHLQEEMAQCCSISGLLSLGSDRLCRRYWLVLPLCALLVEQEPDEVLCSQVCEQRTQQQRFDLESVSAAHFSAALDALNDTTAESTSFMKMLNLEPPLIDLQVEQIEEKSAAVAQLREHYHERRRNQACWWFVQSEEQLDELLNSLNTRGQRETVLRLTLLEWRPLIRQVLSRCVLKPMPLDQWQSLSRADTEEAISPPLSLSSFPSANGCYERSSAKFKGYVELKSRNHKVRGATVDISAHELLELELRECILDLEERLYVGSLGVVRVDNRAIWRDALERGSYSPQDAAFEKLLLGKDTAAKVPEQQLLIRSLSAATRQIVDGVNPRYLIAPLGELSQEEKEKKRHAEVQVMLQAAERDKQQRKRKSLAAEEEGDDNEDQAEEVEPIASIEQDERSTLQHFTESLANCTSLSQLYLHVRQLDRSIMWKKSIMKALCRLCRKKGDEAKLLLCDGCDAGYHMYCLRPKLSRIPAGNWYCINCRPTAVKRVQKKPVMSAASTCKGGRQASKPKEKDNESTSELSEDEEADDEVQMEMEKDDEESSVGCEDHDEIGDEVVEEVKAVRPRRADVVVCPARACKPMAPKRSSKSSCLRSSLPPGFKSAVQSNGAAKKRCLPLDEQMHTADALVKELSEHPQAWPFLQPVSTRQAPDYYKFVQNPMDLGTIRVKLSRLEYNKASEVVDDLRLILKNCEHYNRPEAQEYLSGRKLGRFLEKRIKELSLIGSSSSSNSIIPTKRCRSRTR